MEKKLSKKDIKRRKLILSGNMWYVLICISGPLALFQWMQQFFKVFDMIIASNISPVSVSTVSYISQITNLMIALGTGMSIGSCIKISEAYGAGNYEEVHHRVNTLFKICAIIALIIAAIIPFSAPFLKLVGTPDDFILEGSVYFSIILLDCIMNLFNIAYIGIERVRGNTMRILKLNLTAFVIKLSLNLLFVFVLKTGVTMMAVATVTSDLVVFSAFIRNLCVKNKGDVFSISAYNLKFDKKTTLPLLKVSYPAVAEKFTFQLGKYLTTLLASSYGALVAGALGISNNIGGLVVLFQTGFQDSGAAIISQNVGAGNKRRSLEAFYKLLVINVIIGAVGYFLATSYLPFIASFFDGGDPEFSKLIQEIFIWEAYGCIPLGVFAASTALLYGYGYTKITLLLNFIRLFILRVPVMWMFIHFTDLGSEAVGMCMGISNAGTGIMGGIAAIIVAIKIKKEISIEEQSLLNEKESKTIEK